MCINKIYLSSVWKKIYIHTNNNIYISDNVGKCNRLDKCGYHYISREYFTDNPHKRDRGVSSFSFHREKEEKKIENPPARQTYGATVGASII